MKLYLEGSYMVEPKFNMRLQNAIGRVYYDTKARKFAFVLAYHENPEFLGHYYVNPETISKVEQKETDLMALGGKVNVRRPKGY